ncbi:MAG: hypothetical protein ACRDRV_17705, partial [Pseudonocardiaceae bacterium]
PRNATTPRRRRERYRRQQARLDAEALARWQAIVADWEPLTETQIRAIATILHRIESPTTSTPTRKDQPKRVSHSSR